MFWSQLLLWLGGLPLIFFGILGTMLGVLIALSDEYDGAAGTIFIVGGITLTLVGSGLWFCAGWRSCHGEKK
jgi:hypothetical protein